MQYLEKVIKNLNLKNIEREIVTNNIDKILRNSIENSVGLVFGKVQSGKTRNLICLAAKMFDRDIDLVILLFSDITILLEQNLERFEIAFKDLIDDDYVILRSSSDLEIRQNKELLNFNYDQGKKIIVCGLKNQVHLDRIINTFKDTKYAYSKSIVIDDEGDDITQNTKKEKYNGEGVEVFRTSINSRLVDLKSSINCGLISVTATPQANLLLQPNQALAPSWCEVLEISPEYTGLDMFFENQQLIKVIEDDTSQFINKSGIPKSFIESLAYFITSTTILSKSDNKFKSQMLVHPNRETYTHKNISSKIRDLLTYYFLDRDNELEVMNLFQKCLDEIKIRNSQLNIKLDFEKLQYEDFLRTIKLIYTIELNSKSDLNTKDIKKLIKNNLPYLIFVGGDLLDRGVTFPDLLLTYIFRESKRMQMDTLLQRARWLGYRKSIINFSKVFLTANLYDAYKEIVESDNHLTQMLEYYSNQKNIDLREVDFRIRLKDLYNPTNKSKAIWETNNTSWYVQGLPNVDLNNQNTKFINGILKNLNRPEAIYMNLINEISLKQFQDIIENFNFSKYDSKIINFKKFLSELNLNEDTKVDLLLMRKGDYEERSLNKDKNSINNLFQGQSSKSDNIYPGDRYLLKDKIMIQIHFVKIKEDLYEKDKIIAEKGSIFPMLAIGIPYNLREEFFVQRKTLFNLNQN